MRMWMVEPKIMCMQHLLGEHVECHMFVGHIEKKKSRIDGFIQNDLFEPLSLKVRHDEIAVELEKRGVKHRTPLHEPDYFRYSEHNIKHKINRIRSLYELLNRCPVCKKRSLIH